METVDRETARHWLGNLDYLFIDVRSNKEWESSQEKIERARHLDPDRISSWGKEVPKGKKLVLYCSDAETHCPNIGKKLEGMGFSPVYVIDEGFEGWRHNKFPTVPKDLEGWTTPQAEQYKEEAKKGGTR